MHNKSKQVAVQWFVKLRSSDVTSADRHGHREWLMSDPLHQAAFDEVCEQWSGLDGLDDWARGELGQLNLAGRSRGRRRVKLWTAVLATAASIALAFSFLPITREPPEHYQTVKAEQRVIILKDGSRLHLNTATSVEVRFEAKLREITLSEGEGVFDVEHDILRPFVVRAGGNTVIALGTRFSVEHLNPGKIEITVLEGRVAVVPKQVSVEKAIRDLSNANNRNQIGADTHQSIILEADQQVTVAVAGFMEPVIMVNAANETAWLEGKLVFDGAPLREVAKELSRYIPGQIKVAQGVPDHPVTGIIQIRSMETMLDLLSQVVPITPVKKSPSVTVLRTIPMPPSNG